jgi:1-phosphofructokinase family hexose kinase
VIFATLFNPALDVTIETPGFEPGNTYTGLSSFTQPAGKGINVAKAVKTLGQDAAVIGLIPENDRKRFEEHLSGLGIEAHLMPMQGNVRINATLLESDKKSVTHLNTASEAISMEMQKTHAEFVSSFIDNGAVWALSGSLPKGFEQKAYRDLIQTLGIGHNSTILDTSGDAFRLGIQASPDFVKPNRVELEAFFGTSIQDDDALLARAEALAALGPGHVLVSLGEDGMMAISPTERYRFKVPQMQVVDTVGAGDALVAGLAVGLSKHCTFEESCRLALAAGLSNCLHKGAGNIVRDEVSKLVDMITVDPI